MRQGLLGWLGLAGLATLAPAAGASAIALVTDCASPKACYADGYALYKAGETRAAALEWQTGCALGSANSCRWGGQAYADTDQLPQSRILYRSGCDYHEIPVACFYLGWQLLEGLGGPADPVLGREQLEINCEAGTKFHDMACLLVGKAYYEGNGTDEDWVEARRYMRKACEADNKLGCYNLGLIQDHPLNAFTHDPDGARTAFAKACALGVSQGCDRTQAP